jgi:tRNA(Arg) A34 adenosine deaminase TadA
MNEKFMRQAIELAKQNIENNGGPFAAVIVRNGEVVATGQNRVTANNDPTAHAEVQAIRAACQKLGTFVLADCEIYSSCEPCPMCLGAIYWSHLSKLYYGAGQLDAAEVGFDDSFIYKELELQQTDRRLSSRVLLADEARTVFAMWRDKNDKIEY